MNQATVGKSMSEAEYLVFEEKSKIRHEFMDGEIFAMAGATRKHNLLTTNISRSLGNQLEEGNCEVYASDFRVKIREGHNVYPDVVVACGDISTENNDTTLLNPIVVFEVLSKSTEKRDRGEKAEDYFKLSSLQDYVLVSQNRVRVEHYSRQSDNNWLLSIYENLDEQLVLESINCRIEIRKIYLKINLPQISLVNKKKKNKDEQ